MDRTKRLEKASLESRRLAKIARADASVGLADALAATIP